MSESSDSSSSSLKIGCIYGHPWWQINWPIGNLACPLNGKWLGNSITNNVNAWIFRYLLIIVWLGVSMDIPLTIARQHITNFFGFNEFIFWISYYFCRRASVIGKTRRLFTNITNRRKSGSTAVFLLDSLCNVIVLTLSLGLKLHFGIAQSYVGFFFSQAAGSFRWW